MAFFLGYPKVQFFETANGTGQPMVGGKVKTYIAGTLVPAPTYTTLADANAGINPNPNPIILDERGEAIIVIKSAIKIALFDANDVPVWTVDNIGASVSDIVDTNGNLLLKLTQVDNAVNYVEISNSVTGEAPTITVNGGDTNVSLNIDTKGSGTIKLNSDVNLSTNNLIVDNITSSTNNNLTISANGVGDLNLNGAPVRINNIQYPSTPGNSGDVLVSDGTNFVLQSALPAGIIVHYSVTTVPTGWLECDGAAVSRTTYSRLFSAIGTTYGIGDGTTTFNLPNANRRVLVGRGGTGNVVLANTLGSTGGEDNHLLTINEMPNHAHSINLGSYYAPSTVVAINNYAGLGAGFGTNATGGGLSHNNIQQSLVLVTLIKT